MMTDAEEIADGAETPKYRPLVLPYLIGSGFDIGTGGYRPVVSWAIAVEQPAEAFARYTSGRIAEHPPHLTCGALELPVYDKSMDFVFSSHLIEDFANWHPPIREWTRVIKIGGCIVMLYPDAKLWAAELARGRCPNCDHKHESFVGEMTEFFAKYYGHFEVIEDRLTGVDATDYSILFVARRVR